MTQAADWQGHGPLNPEHRRAAEIIARVLSSSGVLLPGPALNCARACIGALTRGGIALSVGEQEMWEGPLS